MSTTLRLQKIFCVFAGSLVLANSLSGMSYLSRSMSMLGIASQSSAKEYGPWRLRTQVLDSCTEEEKVEGTSCDLDELLSQGKYKEFAAMLNHYLYPAENSVMAKNELEYAMRYCEYQSLTYANPYVLLEYIKKNESLLKSPYYDHQKFVEYNALLIMLLVIVLQSKIEIYVRSQFPCHYDVNNAHIKKLLKLFLSNCEKAKWLEKIQEYGVTFEDIKKKVVALPIIKNLYKKEVNSSFFKAEQTLNDWYNDVALAINYPQMLLLDVGTNKVSDSNRQLKDIPTEIKKTKMFPIFNACELIASCTSWEDFFALYKNA